MHELSIVEEILSKVLTEVQKVGGCKVTEIEIALGEMSGLKEESIRFCFDFLSRGSIAEGAKLSLRRIPGSEIYIESIEAE